MLTRIISISALLTAGLVTMIGCGSQDAAPPAGDSQPQEAVSQTPAEVEVTPEMTEILAKADALDTNTDKTVTLCAACKLGMDGSADHALAVGEYTMHFCSELCRQSFDENLAQAILAIEFPEAQ